MKYSIDEIIDDNVILQSLQDGEELIVSKDEFSFELHEGMILKKINDEFFKDEELEIMRRKSLRERLERLKKID